MYFLPNPYIFYTDVNFVEFYTKDKPSVRSIQLTHLGAYFPLEEMNFSESVEISDSLPVEEFSGRLTAFHLLKMGTYSPHYV